MNKIEIIPIGNGNFVLSGYETEKDLKKAKKDINRFLLILSGMSISKIVDFLAPYRAKFSANCEEEYEEESKKYQRV